MGREREGIWVGRGAWDAPREQEAYAAHARDGSQLHHRRQRPLRVGGVPVRTGRRQLAAPPPTRSSRRSAYMVHHIAGGGSMLPHLMSIQAPVTSTGSARMRRWVLCGQRQAKRSHVPRQPSTSTA